MQVDEVIGRAMKGGALQYELKKTGFSRKDETTWETIDLIKSNSRLYPPYVMKLVRPPGGAAHISKRNINVCRR